MLIHQDLEGLQAGLFPDRAGRPRHGPCNGPHVAASDSGAVDTSRPPREPADSLIPEELEGFRAQLEAAGNFPPQLDTSWMGNYRRVPAADYKISAAWPPNHGNRSAPSTLSSRTSSPAAPATRSTRRSGIDSPKPESTSTALRAEALRREAWAEFEKASAARVPGEIHRKQGFELFHVALGTSVTFQEALTRWDTFTERQRRDWEVCALDAFGEEQSRRQDECGR